MTRRGFDRIKFGEGNLTIQEEIKNLKKDKGEGKKHAKKKISTKTSLEIPPTPRINLENYALDNFCCTHGAYHSRKTCP